MTFALDGGVWLHYHRLRDVPMAHVVSSNQQTLLAVGKALELDPVWLQYKPLKDPRTGVRTGAWHWDLWGPSLRRLRVILERGD
jgi:hypothetical protein